MGGKLTFAPTASILEFYEHAPEEVKKMVTKQDHDDWNGFKTAMDDILRISEEKVKVKFAKL